ncbi:ragulator complex protein LAMTOR5-like [Cylas formicarius]|uniref:ragulator complex protein LAMTOR5-like n=1 Tax=Cylas formicarius TaxID=197179 RepID=UPI0029583C13|nr:ragulator complex protein LAMTOR5-like [Cylas formicarius]
MEKNLDRIMDEIMNNPDVSGCIFSDEQGLCLGAREFSKVSSETAGVITTIANEAAKLEPKNKMPIITLEGDTKLCMIQKTGAVTGAIYKALPK